MTTAAGWLLRSFAKLGVGGVGGLWLGANYHDNPFLIPLRASKPAPAVDASSPSQLAAAATRLANEAGGMCVLSTVGASGGVSSRMIQPLPIDDGGSADCGISFHTTKQSRKFAELVADSRCTLTYINPSTLTCVTFIGEAERLSPESEAHLRTAWPLMPPLSMLYGSSECLSSDFTGWRLRPARVQVVSVPSALGGGPRLDWAPPEISRQGDGPWTLVCRGGMQGL